MRGQGHVGSGNTASGPPVLPGKATEGLWEGRLSPGAGTWAQVVPRRVGHVVALVSPQLCCCCQGVTSLSQRSHFLNREMHRTPETPHSM